MQKKMMWYESGIHARERGSARVATASNFPVSSRDGHPEPWNDTRCAACSTELDCRDSEQYCDRDGCCRKGECTVSQDCAALASLTNYYVIQGFDSPGNDLNALHPQDNLNVLEAACSANPGCVGYTSYGSLKHQIEPPTAWIPEPALKGLTPWVMYLKKSAVDEKNPHMGAAVKTYCYTPYSSAAHAAQPNNPNAALFLHGLCKECLACDDDAACPVNMICDATRGCCVNNPCYVATVEDGAWVDGHYARGNQCACAPGQDYCCQPSPTSGATEAVCSATPCSATNRYTACSYVCQDPAYKHDAVVCKANETCCAGDAPACVPAGTACPAPAPSPSPSPPQ